MANLPWLIILTCGFTLYYSWAWAVIIGFTWSWFAVPAFNMDPLTFIQCLAISAGISIFAIRTKKKEEYEDKSKWTVEEKIKRAAHDLKQIILHLFLPWFFLLMMFVVKTIFI